MILPSHLTGGYCLTGFLGSVVFSINIASEWKLMVACLIGSILPDVDNPKSITGFCVYPFSKFLYSRFGHRTLTHSLSFMILVFFLTSFVEYTWFGNETTFAVILVTAIFVHCLLDSFTEMGVGLLYPFSDRMVWFIASRKWHFKTGDMKAELTFIIAFITLVFVQGDLWKNGFWTTYNQSFASPIHLMSEFNASDDVLKVEYEMRVGTERIKSEGIVLKCDESGIVMIEDNEFVEIGKDVEVLLETKPVHTGMGMSFDETLIFGITADSLNVLLDSAYVWEIVLEGNNKFRTNRFGDVRKLSKKKVTGLQIEEIRERIELEKFVKKTNPRIKSLRNRKAKLERDYKRNLEKYKSRVEAKDQLKVELLNENDLVKRQRLQRKLDDLEDIRKPESIVNELLDFDNEIRELIEDDKFENQSKRDQVNIENESKRTEPLRLNGKVVIVNLHKSKQNDTLQ